MKKWILLFLLCVSCCIGKEVSLKIHLIDATQLGQHTAIPITLEFSRTPDEIVWGLMQRSYLPPNHGMLFEYGFPRKLSFWMFNCMIDLSVAFLDARNVICEIHEMKSYFHKMDPHRPVTCVSDMALYPDHDAIIRFFQKKRVLSVYEAMYALEMNSQWFYKNGAQVGDVVSWNESTGNGWLLRSMDLSDFLPHSDRPLLLTMPMLSPIAVVLSQIGSSRDIAFLDQEKKILQIATLMGGKGHSAQTRPVFYSKGPIKYILVALPGWLQQRGIRQNDVLKVRR